MAAQYYKINYKSDFVLTVNSDAGWAVPFCIKFWTGMPLQGYFAGFDGENYVNCRVGETPTQLLVMFDDHHMPIGELKMQIAYHTTIEEFPDRKFDEVTNPVNVTVDIDGTEYQVMLDFTGETGAEIDFSMPSSGVMSVNGKIGYVTLNAEDVGAQPTIEDLATIRSGAAAGATAVQPATLQEGLATKQDVISDLSTIRSGAAAGATAVQPAALTPIENDIDAIEGKIPSAASASNQLADKAFVNSALSGKADAADIPTALSQLSQDSTHRVVTDEEKTTWNGKQNAIDDLATIRSGAAAGATAVQPAAMNTALAAKQDTLTFDNTPTANSNNPVKSSGIKTALDAKQTTISTVNVTVDSNTGTPSGSASVSGSTLSLSFQNLKGATGATGATGPQGPQGERGLPGESGVTGDVSGFTVIQTIDPSATYGATDIAGAATVQATNQELTELEGELALGAVYDVSAHNNNATFTSLSALLSDANLSTLIPVDVRKGGMSVKFVQSSNNKYVQYRLMKNEWSTNPFDWIEADGSKVEGKAFYVTDGDGNIIAKIDKDGIHSVDFKYGSNGTSVATALNNVEGQINNAVNTEKLLREAGDAAVTGLIEAEEARAKGVENAKLNHTIEDDKFMITDSQGFIIAKIDNKGIHAPNLFEGKFDDDKLLIMDNDGYIIAKVDRNGVHSAKDKHAVACMVLSESYYPTAAPIRDGEGNVTYAEVMFESGIEGSISITYTNGNSSSVAVVYGNYNYTITINRDANGNVETVSVN